MFEMCERFDDWKKIWKNEGIKSYQFFGDKKDLKFYGLLQKKLQELGVIKFWLFIIKRKFSFHIVETQFTFNKCRLQTPKKICREKY
jgi:hypothetical protein